MLYERVVEVDELVVLPLGAEPSQRNGRDAETSARCVRGGKGAEQGSPKPCPSGPPPLWLPLGAVCKCEPSSPPHPPWLPRYAER